MGNERVCQRRQVVLQSEGLSVKHSVRAVAFAIFLLLPSLIKAEADIPPDCRIKNRPPGRCGWCAVETLARHMRIEPLYGLTDAHSCKACSADLETALTERGVRYRIQQTGNTNIDILHLAVRKGYGAAVGFRELRPGKGPHIVTLIDIGPNEVRVIDPNDQDGRVRVMPLDRFLYWWDGLALVLEPDERVPSQNSSASME